MLPEVVKHVHSYWERPYREWKLITKLEPKTSIHDKARDFLNLKKRKRSNEKENFINENDRIKSPKKTKREISTVAITKIVETKLVGNDEDGDEEFDATIFKVVEGVVVIESDISKIFVYGLKTDKSYNVF
ncbi:12122_t:CDS:2 [Cetraspora pellucida]|uniref:12122_t:CDS:1 n=1 Tax=Cetraspora pellucida TaxID=1433469 RepID=A0ACA9L6G7_9GLOM|nr:12122_t:CDS:2 [Cetraspora pellucida]